MGSICSAFKFLSLVSAQYVYLVLLTLQKKKVKRKRSRGERKSSAPDTTPEALEETWKIVEEELKASGFQVSVRINLNGATGSMHCQRAELCCTRACGFKELLRNEDAL